MSAAMISALPTASPRVKTCHIGTRPLRSLTRSVPSTSQDKPHGLPAHQKCGCKRHKVLTHAQGHSGASTKVLKETAALDQLIDLFLGARSQQEVWDCGDQLRNTCMLVILGFQPVNALFYTAGQACCGQHPQLGSEVLAEIGNSK